VRVAGALQAELVRLQCHEGLGVHQALYDWDYPRQLLSVRAGRDVGELYSREFLLARPLLAALEADGPAVLLIDEIDRADAQFEAFLLEMLSEFQVTIPELGTIVASHRPVVILTSSRTRELHDALERRCLYHWIDYPTVEAELQIIRMRLPSVTEDDARRTCQAVARLRALDLYEQPGVGETLMWAHALDAEVGLVDSLGAVLKVREDVEPVRGEWILDDV
jgi:MoxR-like ATPase